jgi:hypothetical protein
MFVTVDFDKDIYQQGEAVKAKVKARNPDGSKLLPGTSFAYSVLVPSNTGMPSSIS